MSAIPQVVRACREPSRRATTSGAGAGGLTTRLYASAARAYLAAGYSPLPLPPSQKWPPPKGWTGAGAPMAGLEQVRRWIRSDPGGNIALRLPEDVIGIDLDLYPDPSKDHPAIERIAAWEALVGELGPLPESPRATSRDDGISGICLYRVPDRVEGRGDPARRAGLPGSSAAERPRGLAR